MIYSSVIGLIEKNIGNTPSKDSILGAGDTVTRFTALTKPSVSSATVQPPESSVVGVTSLTTTTLSLCYRASPVMWVAGCIKLVLFLSGNREEGSESGLGWLTSSLYLTLARRSNHSNTTVSGPRWLVNHERICWPINQGLYGLYSESKESQALVSFLEITDTYIIIPARNQPNWWKRERMNSALEKV